MVLDRDKIDLTIFACLGSVFGVAIYRLQTLQWVDLLLFLLLLLFISLLREARMCWCSFFQSNWFAFNLGCRITIIRLILDHNSGFVLGSCAGLLLLIKIFISLVARK